MLQKLSMTALVGLFSSVVSLVNADCTYSGGNYYCAQTDAIIYSNVGLSATYQDVTNMDESSCACTQADFTASGSLAPSTRNYLFISGVRSSYYNLVFTTQMVNLML